MLVGMQNPQAAHQTMTHCDCVGPELIVQTMESQVCPEFVPGLRRWE